MSVHSPNPAKLADEQKELSKKERANEDRIKYLESLKASRKFQKYVVEEILEKTLNDVFTLDKLPVSDEMEKLGSVALQYVMARKAVKLVFDKLK
jgi:hypothetical protein